MDNNIESILDKYEEQLNKLPNVTGAGIGEKNGEQAIIVFVTQKVPESHLQPRDVIPRSLDGYVTDVQTQVTVGG